MKKKHLLALSFSITAAALLVVAAAFISSIWVQKFHTSNTKPPILVESGWSIKASASSSQEGIITIQKAFYLDEFEKLVSITRQSAENGMPDINGYVTTPSLFFVTHNQKVRVYMNNGEGDFLIYRFGTDGKRFAGTESGTAVHSVRVPYMEKEAFIVSIEFSPSFSSKSIRFDHLYYKLFPHRIPKIYFGFGSQNLQYLIASTWSQWFPALLILICAVASLIHFFSFSIVMKKAETSTLNQFHFQLAVGFSIFFESTLGSYVAGSSFAAYFISTMLLSLQPCLLLMVLQSRKSIFHSEEVTRFFKHISIVNALLVCLFALLPYVPFTLVRIYLMLVLYVCIILGTVNLIHEIISERNSVDVFDIVIFIGIACFLADFMFGIVTRDLFDYFKCTRWATAIFFAVFTSVSLQDYFASEISKAKSSTLKKASSTDISIGCKRALLMWQDERFYNNSKPYGIMLTMIPNFYKLQRDKGIAECETILRMFAQSLKATFSEDDVYILAGAKFAVYIPRERYDSIQDDILELEKSVTIFNDNEPGYRISLVTARSLFDAERDLDFDGLFVRLVSELKYKALEALSRE